MMKRKTAYQAFIEGDTTVVNYQWVDEDTVIVKVTTRNGKVGKFKAKKLHKKDQKILEDEELREVDRR